MSIFARNGGLHEVPGKFPESEATPGSEKLSNCWLGFEMSFKLAKDMHRDINAAAERARLSYNDNG